MSEGRIHEKEIKPLDCLNSDIGFIMHKSVLDLPDVENIERRLPSSITNAGNHIQVEWTNQLDSISKPGNLRFSDEQKEIIAEKIRTVIEEIKEKSKEFSERAEKYFADLTENIKINYNSDDPRSDGAGCEVVRLTAELKEMAQEVSGYYNKKIALHHKEGLWKKIIDGLKAEVSVPEVPVALESAETMSRKDFPGKDTKIESGIENPRTAEMRKTFSDIQKRTDELVLLSSKMGKTLPEIREISDEVGKKDIEIRSLLPDRDDVPQEMMEEFDQVAKACYEASKKYYSAQRGSKDRLDTETVNAIREELDGIESVISNELMPLAAGHKEEFLGKYMKLLSQIPDREADAPGGLWDRCKELKTYLNDADRLYDTESDGNWAHDLDRESAKLSKEEKKLSLEEIAQLGEKDSFEFLSQAEVDHLFQDLTLKENKVPKLGATLESEEQSPFPSTEAFNAEFIKHTNGKYFFIEENGSIAPFRILNYDPAKGMVEITEESETKTMPFEKFKERIEKCLSIEEVEKEKVKEKKMFAKSAKKHAEKIASDSDWEGYNEKQKQTILTTMTEVFLAKAIKERSDFIKDKEEREKIAEEMAKEIVDEIINKK